ncbi:MAG: lipoprotein signal peptidase [Myxococcales bacterium]|nr:lipoprotein signal peptidase [Myxococcales bacterium]
MADDQINEASKDMPAVTDLPSGALEKAKWKIFWIVSILSLVADQATKIWARAVLPVQGRGSLAGGECAIPDDIMTRHCGGATVKFIDGFWEWRLSMNPGSAFGLFGGQSFARVMLSIVGIGAVIGMGWMLKKSRTDQRVLHWALAFVAGGAVGNLIDRIYYGAVTDMVLWRYKTHEWPVFNVADVVLVIGVGLMFIDIQKEGKREKVLKKARQDKAKAAGLVKH